MCGSGEIDENIDGDGGPEGRDGDGVDIKTGDGVDSDSKNCAIDTDDDDNESGGQRCDGGRIATAPPDDEEPEASGRHRNAHGEEPEASGRHDNPNGKDAEGGNTGSGVPRNPVRLCKLILWSLAAAASENSANNKPIRKKKKLNA